MRANLEDPKFVRALKKEVYEKTEALPREVRRRYVFWYFNNVLLTVGTQ
jgi:hypothetical protein